MTLIPIDAVAVFSAQNAGPLNWKDRSEPGSWARIEIVNDEILEFESIEVNIAVPVYIGAIVSQDRQTIYWVNNTRPLP